MSSESHLLSPRPNPKHPKRLRRMKPSNKRGFKELEKRWYRKLEKRGFVDIEDTNQPDRPLKHWDSQRFQSLNRNQNFENPRRASQEFFGAAIDLLQRVRKFKGKHYRKIWRLFCEGLSERDISQKAKIPKSTVHWIIARISKEIKWK